MNILALCAIGVSSGGFSGFIPGIILRKAGAGGGLMGSLVAFAIQCMFVWQGYDWTASLVLVVTSFMLGLCFVGTAEHFMATRWGKRKRHTGEETSHDFNETNIDEVHGQAIAGLAVFLFPVGDAWLQFWWLVAALIMFRVFDTLKPVPVSTAEKCPGV